MLNANSILQVKKYQRRDKLNWDDFIRNSINATFLIERDFMDYHSDRFEDYSLMIFEDDVLTSCIPAHVVGEKWLSHRGLTYGGIFLNKDYSQNDIEELLLVIIRYLKDHNFTSCEFNLSPQIYDPAHELILNSLNQLGFETTRDFENMHVFLGGHLNVSPKKTAGYRNGMFDDFVFDSDSDLEIFYNEVLVPSLQSRHSTLPVHTLNELELLKRHFESNLMVHSVYLEGGMIAGVLFFIKNNIVKSQYAASSPKGFEKRAINYLYNESMKYFVTAGKKIMDYGTVNNDDGSLKIGLKRFKKELGAVSQPMLRLSKII